jgi:ATP-binding cassette subfamily B protein
VPFLRPYRGRIGLALLFLVLAAVSTLLFPVALKSLIDEGGDRRRPRRAGDGAARALPRAVRGGCGAGLFSALRFYMVTWLGERITADLRNAVYAHVIEQSPEFFETTATGEVLSRLTTDTTLVQTVVGSASAWGCATR